MDDLRLYDVVLTDSEITTLYGEAATGIHYQAQALNNPTGFSATGLPTGLSINPTTGAITGHTTAVGDHNITLTASNLSGTSPSKNLILTVAPDKPLFETEPFQPLTLPSLNLWLDASDSASITHSSNAVSQWNDKSGNNNHATAASGQGPTTGSSTINGKNALALGCGKKISSTSPSNANWQNLYLVAKWNGGSTFNTYNGLFTGSDGTGTAGGIGIIGNSGTTNLYANWFNNFHLNGSTSGTTMSCQQCPLHFCSPHLPILQFL